jgi:hypothetical protein
MKISFPTNIKHELHCSKNQVSGELEGIPKTWLRILNNQLMMVPNDNLTNRQQNKNSNHLINTEATTTTHRTTCVYVEAIRNASLSGDWSELDMDEVQLLEHEH